MAVESKTGGTPVEGNRAERRAAARGGNLETTARVQTQTGMNYGAERGAQGSQALGRRAGRGEVGRPLRA